MATATKRPSLILPDPPKPKPDPPSLLERAKGWALGLKKKYLSPIKSKNVVLNKPMRRQLKAIGSSAATPPKPPKKSTVVYWAQNPKKKEGK